MTSELKVVIAANDSLEHKIQALQQQLKQQILNNEHSHDHYQSKLEAALQEM